MAKNKFSELGDRSAMSSREQLRETKRNNVKEETGNRQATVTEYSTSSQGITVSCGGEAMF